MIHVRGTGLGGAVGFVKRAYGSAAHDAVLGFFIGQFARRDGGFQPMLITPEVAMRMAPLVWKAVYDAGRMEFEIEGREGGMARVYDFPARPALCAVNTSIIEGLASSEERRARVVETQCRSQGNALCEFAVRWR